MNNIKFNSISGKIEDSGRTAVCAEFNTWHNEQGIDLTFYGDPEEIKTISLSKDELHCIAVIASAINYIDIPEASKEAASLLEFISLIQFSTKSSDVKSSSPIIHSQSVSQLV
jgi:hypothetical protein